MKKTLVLMLSLTVSSSLLAGCGSQAVSSTENVQETIVAESSVVESSETLETQIQESEVSLAKTVNETGISENAYSPVTIENYNMTTEYTQMPTSVVTLTLNSSEIISALGAGDSVVAIARNSNVLEDVLPEYQDGLKNAEFPEAINTGIPTLEGMLGLSPDLIVANSYYFNVPTFGTVEDYKGNNANLYITEGSYVAGCTIENTYNDIRNLGAIFGKESKAEELISDMQARIETVTEKVSDRDKVRVMAFDSMSDDLPIIAGGTGLEQNLLELAGGENIFEDIEKQFGSVSFEEIISRDPEVIIIHDYTNEEGNAQAKIDLLKNAEELADVSAIKNDRFIVIPLFVINPGLQNVNFVEEVAQELHAEAFN